MEVETIERKDNQEWYEKNPYITTFTGKKFYFLAPTPDMVDLEDIAHALSNLCRFGGHTKKFYSVAQHSYLVSAQCNPENALAGLLHDATEAYLVDIPKPIKGFLTNYVEIENNLYKAIAAKFKLPAELPADVHEADTRMLFTEKEQLCADVDWGWKVSPYNFDVTDCWEPEVAKMLFLLRAKRLIDGR